MSFDSFDLDTVLKRAAELGHELVQTDPNGDDWVCSKCGLWYDWLLYDFEPITCDEVIIRNIIK